jgi:hypothetical protein
MRQLTTLTTAALLTLSLAAACGGSDADRSDADDDNGNSQSPPTSASGGMDSAGGGLPGAGGMGGATSTGSGGEDPFACGEASSQASLLSVPADIIVAVDNSNSMALEASQVKAQINAMVGALTATGIDAHVIMISEGSNNTIFDVLETGVCAPAPLGSGNCPNDENLPAYRHVMQEVASNDALIQIVGTYDQWKDSLRPNASKTFLVVSDDESAMTANEFTNALAGLSPAITDFKFNAIVASESPLTCAVCAFTGCANCANPCCDTSLACVPISIEKGQTYMDLQNQTTGVFGDLCTQNFQPVFADMAAEVIEHTPISCTLDIPTPPNGVLVPDETNVAYVPNGQSTPQSIYYVDAESQCTINGGWYYDDPSNPGSIHLCPVTCDAVKQSTEGEVVVEFGCQTETQPS